MSTVDDLRQNVLSKNVFSLFTFMITLYIKYIYIYNIIYIYILRQYIYIYIYIVDWEGIQYKMIDTTCFMLGNP